MIMERERKKNVPKVLVDIRMSHLEDKRKAKFRLIKEVLLLSNLILEQQERQLIIDETEKGSKIMRRSAGNSLNRSLGGIKNKIS